MARKLFAAITLVVVAVMLFVVAVVMRPFGEPPSVMDDYIIQNTQEVTGANSAVAAVVFVVLFTGREGKARDQEDNQGK